MGISGDLIDIWLIETTNSLINTITGDETWCSCTIQKQKGNHHHHHHHEAKNFRVDEGEGFLTARALSIMRSSLKVKL